MLNPVRRAVPLTVALLAGVFAQSTARAEVNIKAGDVTAEDRFGYSVAISGTTAIVGAPGDDPQGPYSGSAYVFVRGESGWTQQAKLSAADGASNTAFGQSVAIQGDTAVVGAPYGSVGGTPVGAAYVFVRSGSSWTQQAKLTATDAVVYDFFGSALDISNGRVVVGAPYADVFGADSGAAYVFSRSGSTWSQEIKIFPADGRSGDSFGASVSINNLTVAIGAPHDDDNAVSSGSAYVFVRAGSTWPQSQKLRPADGANGDLFGNALDLEQDTLLVGAPEDDDKGLASGAAYVFLRNGGAFAQQQKLLAADGSMGDFFGSALALSGNRIWVGAFLDDDLEVDAGSAYSFSRPTPTGAWSQAYKYYSYPEAEGDNFGVAVALDGTVALAGVEQDGDPIQNPKSGSVFAFDLVTPQQPVPALGHSSLTWLLAGVFVALGIYSSRRVRTA